jgi:hypothetical protein
MIEMPPRDLGTSIPRFVLLDGHQRIGPAVLPAKNGESYSFIYGFSSKQAYDRFCGSANRPLTPYPLVKRFFQSLHQDEPDSVTLVVIDAASPEEKTLLAATSHEVLSAFDAVSPLIHRSYQLNLEAGAAAYRVERLDETDTPVVLENSSP